MKTRVLQLRTVEADTKTVLGQQVVQTKADKLRLVVFRSDQRIPAVNMHRLSQYIKQQAPGAIVVFLDEGTDIEVLEEV